MPSARATSIPGAVLLSRRCSQRCWIRRIAVAPTAGNRAVQAMRRAPHALSALTVARITAADARLCAYGQGRCQARRRYHPLFHTISIPPPIADALSGLRCRGRLMSPQANPGIGQIEIPAALVAVARLAYPRA